MELSGEADGSGGGSSPAATRSETRAPGADWAAPELPASGSSPIGRWRAGLALAEDDLPLGHLGIAVRLLDRRLTGRVLRSLVVHLLDGAAPLGDLDRLGDVVAAAGVVGGRALGGGVLG